MNTDIRLLLSFRSHPKTKKLGLKLGPQGVLSFVWLQMFAAASKPDGILSGMDEEDIALAADWTGDAGEFVRTLVAVKYLDFDGETYSIHDWREHQPWAAGAKERSEHGKKGADARWNKETGRKINRPTKKQEVTPKNDAPGNSEHSSEHDRALQGAQSSNAPSPTPTPSPKPLPTPTPPSVETLSQDSPPQRELPARAREAALPDFSNWKPDEPTMARIRASDPDITDAFIERQRLEFITFAEDARMQPRLMRARFVGRVHAKWIEAKARERNTGPLAKRAPEDLRKVRDDDLEKWSLAHGGPKSNTGESYDDYRSRIADTLRRGSAMEAIESVADGMRVRA